MPEEFKIVCQLDEEGYLVGAAYAFANPERPGAFLIPGGAIDKPVPEVPEGKRAKWTGSDWEFSDIPPELQAHQ